MLHCGALAFLGLLAACQRGPVVEVNLVVARLPAGSALDVVLSLPAHQWSWRAEEAPQAPLRYRLPPLSRPDVLAVTVGARRDGALLAVGSTTPRAIDLGTTGVALEDLELQAVTAPRAGACLARPDGQCPPGAPAPEIWEVSPRQVSTEGRSVSGALLQVHIAGFGFHPRSWIQIAGAPAEEPTSTSAWQSALSLATAAPWHPQGVAPIQIHTPCHVCEAPALSYFPAVVAFASSAGDPAGGVYPVGIEPISLRLAGLRRDQEPDLVVIDRVQGVVGVLHNQGKGAFPGPLANDFSGTDVVGSLVTADLDGDGSLDVALLRRSPQLADGNVELLFNDGAGRLSRRQKAGLQSGSAPTALVTLKRSTEPLPALVVSDQSDGKVRVYANHGAAGFAAAEVYQLFAPLALATGDLDGDGQPDLVGGGETGVVLLSPIAGASDPYGVGTGISALLLADVDGDGALDIVAGSRDSGLLFVLRNDGRGRFPDPPASYPALPAGVKHRRGDIYDGDRLAMVIRAADVNRDGWLDLIVSSNASPLLVVLLNQGVDGGLSAAAPGRGLFLCG